MCCKWFGSIHDSRLFSESIFLRKFAQNLPDGMFIVGDQAFIGINKVKVPIHMPLTTPQYNFNYQLGKQRIIVENTFGLFKGKFKRFFFEQKNGELKKMF